MYATKMPTAQTLMVPITVLCMRPSLAYVFEAFDRKTSANDSPLWNQISMSALWIPMRVTRTLNVPILRGLIAVLANKDLLEMAAQSVKVWENVVKKNNPLRPTSNPLFSNTCHKPAAFFRNTSSNILMPCFFHSLGRLDREQVYPLPTLGELFQSKFHILTYTACR